MEGEEGNGAHFLTDAETEGALFFVGTHLRSARGPRRWRAGAGVRRSPCRSQRRSVAPLPARTRTASGSAAAMRAR